MAPWTSSQVAGGEAEAAVAAASVAASWTSAGVVEAESAAVAAAEADRRASVRVASWARRLAALTAAGALH